jgi:DNA-binding NarL/FixJ family response regulator
MSFLKILQIKLIKRNFTKREIEVTLFVCEGLKNIEIGDKTFTTEKAVKFILTNVYRKTGIKNRAGLIVYCFNLVLEDIQKSLDDIAEQLKPLENVVKLPKGSQ